MRVLLEKRAIALYLGPVLGVFFWRLTNNFLEPDAAKVMGVASTMVYWWVSAAIPIPVVALLPLVLFPALGVMSPAKASAPYGNTVVFLFLGGFLLGAALEKWDLHRRIALQILVRTGPKPERVLLGFIVASAALSMWISNTATAMMMWPIALSVIALYTRKNNEAPRNFIKVLFLGIAYSCSIGGMATLIGTPPNVVMRGYMADYYSYSIGFLQWMLFATPLVLLLLALLYFFLLRFAFKEKDLKGDVQDEIRDELNQMGKLSIPEKRVLIVFLVTAAGWIFRPLINVWLGIQLDDTAIAVAGAFSLFLVPSGGAEKRKALLQWEDTRSVSWGVILLFGGGLSLASAMEQTGLVALAGVKIGEYFGSGMFLLLLGLTLLALFLTEVMSNVALVSIFVPVVAGIAVGAGQSPLLFAIPVTLASSCAFMLPTATPPNSVVFASGELKVSDMVRTGIWLNLMASALIVLFSYFLIPLFF
jgi:solute carrier family 13 (sodium-dependent dicarboxylate transporter), member 2/3/5